MKTITYYTKAVILALLISTSAVYAGGPSAYVQLIHNCAAPAAANVSVFADFGTGQVPVAPSFAFRSASAFLPVASGTPFTVYIKAPNASASDPALYTQNIPALAADSSYVVIASGVIGNGFAANPNSLSTAFELKLLAPARRQAFAAGKVEFAVFHGATDAPGVDVNLTGGATLVPNAEYGDASGYLSVDPTWYPIDIAPAGSSTPVASYVADLSTLAGGSAVVFASGFLNPLANNNGAAFGLFAALADGTVLELPAQEFAKVQVIHNCAAPAASQVDVYIDGAKALDNFEFRTATGFIDLLAGVNHTIAVAPSTSTSVGDALASFPNINVAANQNYIVVASGVVGSGFAANPDGRNIDFTLKVIANAQTAATNASKVDFAVLHGATDAPGVDVNLTGGATLVPNARYGDATSYLSVDPTWYPIDIAPAGNATPVASYVADLSSLTGGAALVFASGFLTPANNNSGPAFGLFAALADGTVLELPVQEFANVQVLHNCAAPAANLVDVYIDGAKALDDFAFRSGTGFIDVLAGVNHTIAVAPSTSTSVGDALASFPNINVAANQNYIVVASGVVGSGFAANPDGRNTDFTLKVIANAQTAATNASKVDFAVLHGATDAPGVDVNLTGGATLVSNARYGDATAYLSVDPTWYPIDIAPAGNATPVASYVADLTTLTGGSALVFASGFLTPANNNSGPAFGLFALLADGTVLELPVREKAKVQVLHNCADPIADSVDIYINGALALDNFPFRTATPFIELTAGFPNIVHIAPKTSTSIANAVWDETYTLDANTNYVLTASGVIGSGFAANPNGKSTGFEVLVKASAQTQALVSTNFDFFAIHGSTDAPAVDVVANGALTVINNFFYGDQTGYIPVPAANYTLAVKDSGSTTTVAEYVADLTTLNGKSGVVLASGFLTPSANNNGPAFGLYVALPAGGPFVALPVVTSINDDKANAELSIYPNPSNGTLFINTTIEQSENMSLLVTDATGAVVKQLANGTTMAGKQTLAVDMNDLSNGMYIVRLTTAGNTITKKFNLVK